MLPTGVFCQKPILASPTFIVHVLFLTLFRYLHCVFLLLSFFRFSALAPSSASFHFSARREEEAKEPVAAKDEGFLGTGISHLYAIPLGVCAAVPILEFQWFRPNEEMLVRAFFNFS